MRLCSLTRLFVAAATVLLAAPAFGQANVSVTLSAGDPATDADVMSLGVAKTFTLTVANGGPTHVTAFNLDATLTPPAAPYTAEVGAIKGCAPLGVCKGGTNANEACTVLADCPDQTAGTACFTGLCKGGTNANEACNALADCPDHTSTDAACSHPVVPCRVKLASALLSGGSTKVSIPVTVVAPNPLPTAPAECPSQMEAAVAGSASTNATVSVPKLFQGTTEVVDPNTSNNTATLTTRPAPLNDFNDLAVTDFTAPANASEGQNIQYSVTLHNYGPCPGTNTFSDFFPTGTLGFVSATGCDNNGTFQDAKGNIGCVLASTPFAPGSNRTYTATWTVLTFPKSVIKATLPVSVDLFADEDLVNGPDPDAPDHSPSAEVVTTVDLSKNDTLCSMGGGSGTLLSLLSLLALRFARRRAS